MTASRPAAMGLGLALLLCCASAHGQEDPPDPRPAETERPAPPGVPADDEARPAPRARYADSIDVVATTPVDGWGTPRDKIPANVQSLDAHELGRGGVAGAMERLLPNVQLQETQGSSFQPDLQLRGFSASPLLGVPQGVAVYQDGARLNDPFGDTVRWDLVPSAAIARLDVLPGSNPLFGFNAMGGVLLLETKDGFGHPGLRGAVAAGSFGRRSAELEWGAARARGAAFVAVHHLEEDGWRDVSSSRISQLFGSLSWAGARGIGSLSLSGAANRLHGNGPAPVALLAEDRRAVFTHPDVSEPEAVLLTGRLHRFVGRRLQVDAATSFRRQRLATFNGDAASFEPCPAPGATGLLCREDEEEPLRGPDGGFLPAELGADAVANRTSTVGWSAGTSLQIAWEAGREHTSRTALGLTGDLGRADYVAGVELAELTRDRGTEGLGLELLDERDRIESRTSTVALFALETLDLSARTTLALSARWQRAAVRLVDRLGTALDGDHEFDRLAPAVGLTHARGRWTLFGSLGVSARAPTAVELTCADPQDPCRLPNAFVSDPPLEQVVTRTIELGARSTWRGVQVAAALFRSDSRDDILFVSSGGLTGSGHFENVGTTRRQGAELSLQGRLPRDGRWFVGYGYLHATFRSGFSAPAPNHPEARGGALPVAPGDRLPLLPEHTGKAGLELPVGRARLGASVIHLSERSLRGDEANLLPPLPAFSRVDMWLSHPLGRRLVAVLDVDNLLDREHATFGLLGEPGEVLKDAPDDPRFVSPASPRTISLILRFTGADGRPSRR